MTLHHHKGATLIEVLIAMLIVAFGVLGFVGIQTRSAVANVEGYQRAQALILVNDMAERINLNRANAAAYRDDDPNNTATTPLGVADPGNCAAAGPAIALKDRCEWARLIQGAAETEGTTKLGAVLNARGCITNTAPDQYRISLAWQGVQASGAPTNPCGLNAFGSEETRRVVSVVVRIGSLQALP